MTTLPTGPTGWSVRRWVPRFFYRQNNPLVKEKAIQDWSQKLVKKRKDLRRIWKSMKKIREKSIFSKGNLSPRLTLNFARIFIIRLRCFFSSYFTKVRRKKNERDNLLLNMKKKKKTTWVSFFHFFFLLSWILTVGISWKAHEKDFFHLGFPGKKGFNLIGKQKSILMSPFYGFGFY